MNAQVSAILNVNKKFFQTMSSLEAVDKGYPMILRMLVAEYQGKPDLASKILKFEENVTDQVANGEYYNIALRLAMYHYLPGSERILGMKRVLPGAEKFLQSRR